MLSTGEHRPIRSFVLRSEDRGLSWEYWATVAFDPALILDFFEPAMARLASGRLICVLRTQARPGRVDHLWCVHSDDDGASWSRPERTPLWGFPADVRQLADGRVLAGFAGGTADAFTLFELFEGKLEQYGNLARASIELAKDWRTDRRLRRLEALLCVADTESSFIVSGNGDVIEPEHDLMAIGSGGPYAQAAALALIRNTELEARDIAEQALNIAGEICVYTNQNIIIEEL